MGRNQDRAIWLIEETTQDLKERKMWSETNPCISRSDFVRIWNRVTGGMSLSTLDVVLLCLKAEFVLGENNRSKDYSGYYFNQEYFDKFKKRFGEKK